MYSNNGRVTQPLLSKFLINSKATMYTAQSAISILALLTCAAIVIIIGIEYTYSSNIRRYVPSKRERMHVRGFLFVLLACIGLMLACVAYLASTQGLRSACYEGRTMNTMATTQ